VHGYWSIDLAVLHTTATGRLPAFAGSLQRRQAGHLTV
jgi:hypothetical protein